MSGRGVNSKLQITPCECNCLEEIEYEGGDDPADNLARLPCVRDPRQALVVSWHVEVEPLGVMAMSLASRFVAQFENEGGPAVVAIVAHEPKS